MAGSSTYYIGGVNSYAYEAKVRLLKVSWETLEKYGAVSRETALEMALGVRRLLATNIGISITGIAGPGGGTPEKPVGLTWIGLSTSQHNEAKHFIWSGDRVQNKEQSVEATLQILWEYLRELKDGTG